MNYFDLLAQLALGEDSTRQFKADVRNADSLASEMASVANSEGGTIFVGVADDGSTPGLWREDVGRINQLISNAASQLVRSPLTVQTENVPLVNERVVVVLKVPKGIDKPYFDKNGVIWLKNGADKRRINSKEELRRLFQLTEQFHADELPTKAGIEALDKLRFRDFLRTVYKRDLPDNEGERLRLLRNMNLATDDGRLNLAGVLMSAEQPEWIAPQFVVKAIRYPGNTIHMSEYLDTEDFSGPLRKVFDDALAFVMRNLHKIQAGRGVNAPGTPEIPEVVFEELLVNALVHRDYLVSAPIRLFVFDDRVEIISPGHLPNNLTVEKIRAGNSNIRNPILVSFVAKGLLPYHGRRPEVVIKPRPSRLEAQHVVIVAWEAKKSPSIKPIAELEELLAPRCLLFGQVAKSGKCGTSSYDRSSGNSDRALFCHHKSSTNATGNHAHCQFCPCLEIGQRGLLRGPILDCEQDVVSRVDSVAACVTPRTLEYLGIEFCDVLDGRSVLLSNAPQSFPRRNTMIADVEAAHPGNPPATCRGRNATRPLALLISLYPCLL